MDTKKNMSREQLLAYMRDNCTEAEAQQVRMWLRERLKAHQKQNHRLTHE